MRRLRFTHAAGRAQPVGILRGAFGAALRELACLTGASTCDACPCTAHCGYARVFAPELREHAADAPSHYAVLLPDDAEAGRCTVELRVFGAAVGDVATIRAAWEQAADRGFGAERERWRVTQVDVLAPEDVAPAPCMRRVPGDRNWTLPDVVEFPGLSSFADRALRVRFTAPVRLRYRKQTIRQPQLVDLVIGAVRRAGLLSGFLGLTVVPRPRGPWTEAARAITGQRFKGQPAWLKRWSARQQAEIRLDGVTGILTLGAGAGPFTAWLLAGSWLGVGRSTVLGCGFYRIELVDPAQGS